MIEFALIEYLDYIVSRYGHKIGSLHLGTNGTIYPRQDVLDACKNNHVIVDISDYSKTIGTTSKLHEIRDICLANDISVEIKRTGEQWLVIFVEIFIMEGYTITVAIFCSNSWFF